MIIIQIIILIYIVIVIYQLIKLQKYNINGTISITNSKKDILTDLKKLNPCIYKDKSLKSFSYQSMVNEKPAYLIVDGNNLLSIKSFKEELQLYIFKNSKISKDFNLKDKINFDLNFLQEYDFLFPIQYSLSMFKGGTIIPLQKCVHNYNIIGCLEGDSVIFLFNPKHKDDILNKDNNEIKKWGHKIILKENDILIIPTNWFYIQEINKACIQYHIDADTYFTFIPNFLK
jgi:hypothetical protein